MGQRKQSYRAKKRAFYGNKHTSSKTGSNDPQTPENAENQRKRKSSSALKLGKSKRLRLENEGKLEGNRIMDITILSSFISTMQCPDCQQSSLKIEEVMRYGLASKFVVTCGDNCGYSYDLYSSAKATDNGKKFFTINRLLPVAVMSTGNHYTAARRLITGLNLPPPQTLSSWQKHFTEVKKATETVASVSMRRAAKDAGDDSALKDIVVSCDGTWQRRGFASKNGVGTVLTVPETGKAAKVVDTCTLSNHCAKCKSGSTAAHNCPKNHEGSAGSMEPAAMMTIFKRSVRMRRLQYTGYLGDGDSKSFNQVSTAQPPIYKDKPIKKLECCGHVQKRMGKRLADKVAEYKSKSFTENGKTYRGIGGAGRLTTKAIKSIQGHYGAAIRNHSGDLAGMKRAIWAIYQHRNKDHRHCGSWCPAVKGTGNANLHALPNFVCQAIKPVFETLSSNDLLEKCLHGGSQNPNESFHNVIWARCPKSTFVGRHRLEVAVADATIVYNEGELARKDIYTLLRLPMSSFLVNEMKIMDQKRVNNANVPGDRAVLAKRRAKSTTSASQKNDEAYGAGKF